MANGGYLDLGTVEARTNYYINNEQQSKIKQYFLCGLDKPVFVHILGVTDADRAAGRAPLTTLGYVMASISATASTIYLKAPFVTTTDVTVGENTITVATISERTLFAIAR